MLKRRLDPKQRTLTELPKSAPIVIPFQKKLDDPLILEYCDKLFQVRVLEWHDHPYDDRWRRKNYYPYRQLMRDFRRDGFIEYADEIWELIQNYGPEYKNQAPLPKSPP